MKTKPYICYILVPRSNIISLNVDKYCLKCPKNHYYLKATVSLKAWERSYRVYLVIIVDLQTIVLSCLFGYNVRPTDYRMCSVFCVIIG